MCGAGGHVGGATVVTQLLIGWHGKGAGLHCGCGFNGYAIIDWVVWKGGVASLGRGCKGDTIIDWVVRKGGGATRGRGFVSAA